MRRHNYLVHVITAGGWLGGGGGGGDKIQEKTQMRPILAEKKKNQFSCSSIYVADEEN